LLTPRPAGRRGQPSVNRRKPKLRGGRFCYGES